MASPLPLPYDAATRRLIAAERVPAEGQAWPVSGAAIGYFGYEVGRPAAGLPADKAGTTPFPAGKALGAAP